MPKGNPPPKPTPESRLISAALARLKKAGRSEASVAEAIGVAPAILYQYKTARRPVPPERAPLLASELGERPEAISVAYGPTVSAIGSALPAPDVSDQDPRRPDLTIRRLENDNKALNMALGYFAVAMVNHRPTEARDVREAIRKTAPKNYRDRGFLRELLEILDKA